MKKDHPNPSDSRSERNLDKGSNDYSDSPPKKNQEPGKDMSFTDLDNIFFPDDKIDDLLNRDSFSSDNLDNLDGIPPENFKTSQPPPIREPRIKIEDATPIPIPEEGPKKTVLSEIDLSRKLTDLRSEIKKKKAKYPKQGIESPFFSQLSDKSGSDITKVFVPANRIDEKGNVLPEKPEDTTGIQKPSLQKAKTGPLYTVLLAYGRRIHFKKTIDVCAEFLEIAPQEAERRIRFGKGILFEHMDEDKALFLQKQFLAISQGVRIIQENTFSRIPEAKDVIVWLFSRRHFQIQTEKEKLVLPWDDIQLVCSGNVRLHFVGDSYKKTLDVIMINPFVHLRIWDTTFDYKRSGINEETLGKLNFLNLIKVIKRFNQKARFSPTINEMLDKNNNEPRNFESIEEFDNYARWLFLSFFGKPLR
jgi:hypothetical protein